MGLDGFHIPGVASGLSGWGEVSAGMTGVLGLWDCQ